MTLPCTASKEFLVVLVICEDSAIEQKMQTPNFTHGNAHSRCG